MNVHMYIYTYMYVYLCASYKLSSIIEIKLVKKRERERFLLLNACVEIINII